ncbi:hypothetical protein HK103_001968 [Boothiomyces macroporosus]|uniref:Uncharacterized protein n=1 Tax=Boothiomyces macroporosus TaxID=261099 RepID=A0AAD5UJF7_9FUNG|nr:hypothetical protein HK103_001968 [Boothiomyces macroporosus]
MNTSLSADVPAVFQVGWLHNYHCATPPNVMFSFTGITTALYNETINEQFSLDSCGNNLFPMNGGCCFSNIDTSYFSGYTSLTQRAAFTGKSNFPVAADGASYCHLQKQDNGSLYGYSDIWYIADSSCIESRYSCLSSGEFRYYSQGGCAGTSKSVQLSSKTAKFNFADMGGITGEMVTISGGSEVYTWTAYIPSAELVFKYQVPMELVSLICYIFGVMISLVVFVYFIFKYIRTRSSYMTIVVISQLLWVIWISLDFGYLNIAFPVDPMNWPQRYAQVKACIFNLAALTTVLNTANFIIGFRTITGLGAKIVIYSAIVILHIVLAGGYYFDYWYLTTGEGSFWQRWIQLLPFWTLLMFIFNTVPAFSIAVPLVKNSEYLQKMSTFTAITKLLVVDKKFCGLVFLQLVNIVSIISFYYIQQFTQIPGSDRNFLSMYGIFAFIYALHAGTNCLFIEHIRTVLKIRSGYSQSVKSRSTNLMVLRPLSSTGPTESTTSRLTSGHARSAAEPGSFENFTFFQNGEDTKAKRNVVQYF